MEEGLDEDVRGVPGFRGVSTETKLGLEESLKIGLQETGKGSNNGGVSDNKDL